MKLGDEDHTPAVIETILVAYTLLDGRDDTRDKAEPLKSAVEDLQAKDLALLWGRVERRASTARIGWLDGVADRAYMGCSRAVLHTVDNNRKHPTFKLLFPEAPSDTADPVGGDEQARDYQLLIHLLRTEAAAEPFAAHADTLEAALTALRAEEARRKQLDLEVAKLSAARDASQAAAKALYNGLPPHLQLQFPNDPKLVRALLGG